MKFTLTNSRVTQILYKNWILCNRKRMVWEWLNYDN